MLKTQRNRDTLGGVEISNRLVIMIRAVSLSFFRFERFSFSHSRPDYLCTDLDRSTARYRNGVIFPIFLYSHVASITSGTFAVRLLHYTNPYNGVRGKNTKFFPARAVNGPQPKLYHLPLHCRHQILDRNWSLPTGFIKRCSTNH